MSPADSLAARWESWATFWRDRRVRIFVTPPSKAGRITSPFPATARKNGTLHGILKDVAAHHGLSMEELLRQLDL